MLALVSAVRTFGPRFGGVRRAGAGQLQIAQGLLLMEADAESDDPVEHTPHSRRANAGLVIAALAVVFGDLGTSPRGGTASMLRIERRRTGHRCRLPSFCERSNVIDGHEFAAPSCS